MKPASVALALITAAPLLANAETAAPADKSAYTLFNPTPADRMRAMNTDRPDTTESPFTVDAGHFQVEATLLDYNRDKSAGVTTRTWTAGSLNLKAGLLNNTDIQFIVDTYADTKVSGAGAKATVNGISDLTVRLKQNLWGNESDTTTAFALMPWVSAPTGSDGVGADKWQGGLIAPLGFTVSEGVAAAVMAQGDILWNGDEYYVQWTHSATCGITLTESLGMFVEYVGQHDSGPASNYRASGNIGFTYAVNDNLIWDTGVRLGLNSRADDFGWFAGVSYRH